MFTGLIEEKGSIVSLIPGTGNARGNLELEVSAQLILEDIKLGDSISVDGVCQTVTRISDHSFWVTAVEETLRLTNFRTYSIGTKVNLERCLRVSDRLGGHIVQGHVDGLGIIKDIKCLDGSKEFYIEVPKHLSKYIVHKGSITISGISLTVASIEENLLSVAIIPKTLEVTTLGELTAGAQVNIEVDILAKYLEKLSS